MGEHGYGDNKLWCALREELGLEIMRDPIGEADPEKNNRPKGHSTHNMLVKCKKTKKLFLITLVADRIEKICLKNSFNMVPRKTPLN